MSALLDAIAHSTPRLAGAACRDHRPIFDQAMNTRSKSATRAIAVCRQCPALADCGRWLDTLAVAPRGVIAGRRITARPA